MSRRDRPSSQPIHKSDRLFDKIRPFRLVWGAVFLAIAVSVWWLWSPSTEQLEQNAADALQKGNLSLADAYLLRLQRRRPQDVNVLNALADVAFRQGRSRDCMEWLGKAAEESSTPAVAFVEAGARAFQFHHADLAEQFDQRAIAANPQFLGGYSALARLTLITQQTMRLREIIGAADRQQAPLSDDPVLLWLWVVGTRGQWGGVEAEDWLRHVVKQDPQNAIIAAALARNLVLASRFEDAQKLWSTPLAEQSDAWPLQLVKAEWEWQSGAFAAAVKTIANLPLSADHDPRTWHLRAQVAAIEENLPVALGLTEETLRLDPLMVEAGYLHGQLLNRLGRSEEARMQLARAAQLDQLLQRVLQLLQQSTPESADALAVAELAVPLKLDRWAQLVTEWMVKRSPSLTLPESLQALRQRTESMTSLSVPVAVKSEQGRLRREFENRRRAVTKSSETASPAALPTLRFNDVTSAMNLNFEYEYGHAPERWLMETLGGGVAAMDYDCDGQLDLFFAQAGRLSIDEPSRRFEPCVLFRNVLGRSFENVTNGATAGADGYFHGCVAGDFNEDGFVDLVLCGYGQTTFLCNQGDGTWTDKTAVAGLINDRWTTSGAAFDWDRDGDLDLYQAAYCEAPLSPTLRTCRSNGRFAPCRPNAYSPAKDILWENRGDGTFVDMSRDMGITEDPGYGLGTVAADFDNDGWDDIFVGNDTTANFLWWNQGKGRTFSEGGLAAGVGLDGQGRAEACMGIACGDVDGNGFLDLFVTNFHDETATLYLNHGGRLFSDETETTGLSNAGRKLMGWGTQFGDFNADGWLDAVILNGHLHDTPQLPQLYLNVGGRFRECSDRAGEFFQQAALGRSIAVGDFNGDGRDDLAISHQTGRAAVLQNDSEGGGMVRLQLIGSRSNRDSASAIIRAWIGKQELMRMVSRQGGYLSSSSSTVSLGLGKATQLDRLEIVWPSGQIDRYENVPSKTTWLLREGQIPITILHERD